MDLQIQPINFIQKHKRTVDALMSSTGNSKHLTKGQMKELETLKEYAKLHRQFDWEADDRVVL